MNLRREIISIDATQAFRLAEASVARGRSKRFQVLAISAPATNLRPGWRRPSPRPLSSAVKESPGFKLRHGWRGFWALAAVLALASGLSGQEPASPRDLAVRFAAVDVWLDPGANPLAAYQLTFTITNVPTLIVGIEGGEHAAFKEPPYYDPQAIQHERVIIAAFNTAPAGQLPQGKTRVATIHLQVSGERVPESLVQLQVAAGPDGQSIPCTVNPIPRNAQ